MCLYCRSEICTSCSRGSTEQMRGISLCLGLEAMRRSGVLSSDTTYAPKFGRRCPCGLRSDLVLGFKQRSLSHRLNYVLTKNEDTNKTSVNLCCNLCMSVPRMRFGRKNAWNGWRLYALALSLNHLELEISLRWLQKNAPGTPLGWSMHVPVFVLSCTVAVTLKRLLTRKWLNEILTCTF